jgi:hypothetical protein
VLGQGIHDALKLPSSAVGNRRSSEKGIGEIPPAQVPPPLRQSVDDVLQLLSPAVDHRYSSQGEVVRVAANVKSHGTR